MNDRFLRLFAVASLLMVVACSNDKDNSPDPATPFPYARPSVATMQMNVTDLEQVTTLTPTGVCHALSALAVAWINANVAVRLVIPAAAVDACFHQVPVYLGDDSWRWTAAGGLGLQAWTAEMTGHARSENQIDWAMRISGTALQLDRFLWFDGPSDTAARSGIWHYYDPASPGTSRELVSCMWSLPLPLDTDRELEFENVATGTAGFGDLLRYELADSIADISLYLASEETTSRAHWDLRDGLGLAVSAGGDTCCWGARPTYLDIDCP